MVGPILHPFCRLCRILQKIHCATCIEAPLSLQKHGDNQPQSETELLAPKPGLVVAVKANFTSVLKSSRVVLRKRALFSRRTMELRFYKFSKP